MEFEIIGIISDIEIIAVGNAIRGVAPGAAEESLIAMTAAP